MLLLLLGCRLRRRGKQTTRNRDVNRDIESKASAQAAADSAEADAKPMPKLAPDCSVGQPVNGLCRVSTDFLLRSAFPATVNPSTLPETLNISPSTLPETLNISPSTLPETLNISPSTLPETFNISPSMLPETLNISPSTLPVTLNISLSTLPATLVVNPSTLPAPVLQASLRGDRNSQGKLAEAVEVAPEDKAARSRARRASIKDTEAALAEMFARGAKGTKDGPGRLTSRSRTPAAHSRAPARQGSPDNIWAPVRARRAAIQAADALREPDLPYRQAKIRKMHIEREQQLSKERSQRLLRSHRMRKGLSSQEGPIVRV